MIYLTSDSHFSHRNILKYCNRPFSSIEEMNEAIINNWNSVVTTRDIVYHLGDFGFGNASQLRPILERLNGRIHLVPGSHDTELLKDPNSRLWLNIEPPLLTISIKQYSPELRYLTLCHYPMWRWYKSHFWTIHAYGHVHTSSIKKVEHPSPYAYDVGVDNNNYYPISLEDLRKKIHLQIGICQEETDGQKDVLL